MYKWLSLQFISVYNLICKSVAHLKSAVKMGVLILIERDADSGYRNTRCSTIFYKMKLL